MGEQNKHNKLLQYYLGIDYTCADTKTIQDAEKFFSEEYKKEVYIIPPENKICMNENHEDDSYIRYYLDKEKEVWIGDYEDDREYDISPYGDLYLTWMEEEFPTNFSLMVLKGQHLEKAEKINLTAKDKLFDLKQELLKNNPYTDNNNLEMAKHLIMLEGMAKEIVLNDYVYIPPSGVTPKSELDDESEYNVFNDLD